MAVRQDRQYLMNAGDVLGDLYNPYDNLLNDFGNPNGITYGGGGGNSISVGGGTAIPVPPHQPVTIIDPIVVPNPTPISITTTPKVTLKVTGLEDSSLIYAGQTYYDNSNIDINVLTTLDSVQLKPEYGEFEEYYVVSYEDVVEQIQVNDVVPFVSSIKIQNDIETSGGGSSRVNSGMLFNGGVYNPEFGRFTNLVERAADMNAQK